MRVLSSKHHLDAAIPIMPSLLYSSHLYPLQISTLCTSLPSSHHTSLLSSHPYSPRLSTSLFSPRPYSHISTLFTSLLSHMPTLSTSLLSSHSDTLPSSHLYSHSPDPLNTSILHISTLFLYSRHYSLCTSLISSHL